MFDDNKNAKIYVENIGSEIIIGLLDPDLIREYFEKDLAFYDKHELLSNNFNIIIGKSFFL